MDQRKIVGFNGSMAIVDTGTVIVRVNQTKLRKDFNKLAGVPVTLKDEPAPPAAEPAPPADPDTVAYLDRLWLPITQSKTDFQQLYYSSAWLSSACADESLRIGLRLISEASRRPEWTSFGATLRLLSHLLYIWTSHRQRTSSPLTCALRLLSLKNEQAGILFLRDLLPAPSGMDLQPRDSMQQSLR